MEDRRETIVPKPNNLPYIVAVVVMMGFGLVGIVAITIIKPTSDNTLLIGTILGFLAPTTLSLLAFMKSQETHLSVNSRLDAFMSNAKLAAHSQGLTEGRLQGRESADARTDVLASNLAAGLLPTPAVTNPLENIEKNTKETADTLKEISEK